MKRGFTLVELLVVVLIIGILSAIAIPMYQGAVDKSHWSTMLPGAKAIKDAEEAIKMSNGLYTANMENLDVRMPDGDVQYTIETINDDGSVNVVRATNSKLPNVRLSSYLDENVNFAGQLHCEANDGPEGRGTRLCEKLLGGQYVMSVDGGYTAYLLDQEIDEGTCKHAEQSWSSSKTKCYRTNAARCEALGSDDLGNKQCGYTNQHGKEIGAESVCRATSGGYANNYDVGCNSSIVSNGGECIADAFGGCHHAEINQGGKCVGNHQDGCNYITVNAGGICEASVMAGCSHMTVNSGGKCISNAYYGCYDVTYVGTGCCEGQNCPSDHKCPQN
ncbi:MAG: prepilin-type N-terminal cleavage/methylation domain-containing protein [Elusimicrobiaceae bacterium]|nr:prepilin-type N-terminal cleavage/methylation domain-containing protein [Elusimicrobiaceae bacterium]